MGRHHDEQSVDPAHARQVFRFPLESDPLLWWTGGVSFFFFVAVWGSDEPDPDIPPLVDGLLAAVVMGFLFGVVPALIRLMLTQRRARKVPHLVRAAPGAVVERLERAAPFPLATAVGTIEPAPSLDERFRSILDVAQTAGVCVAAFLVGTARRKAFRLDTTEPALHSLHRSMTEPGVPFDAWMLLCVPLLDEIGTGSDAQLAAARRALTADRHELRGILPSGTSAGQVERSRRALDRLLREATLLVDTSWLLVDEVSPRPDWLFEVTAVAAMGRTSDFPLVLELMELDTATGEGGVVARTLDDGWICLDPLVIHRQAANGRRLIYYFEQVGLDRSATYRSFANGSIIVIPDRSTEVLRCAEQLFGHRPPRAGGPTAP